MTFISYLLIIALNFSIILDGGKTVHKQMAKYRYSTDIYPLFILRLAALPADIIIHSGNNFQTAALDAAQCGDSVTVDAGTSFSPIAANTFILPAKTTGCVNSVADTIWVRSSNYTSLPAGRVGISDAANMFKLVSTSAGFGLLAGAQNSKWWKFEGLEATNSGTNFANTLIQFAGPSGGSAQPSEYGDNITITKSYIHPQEDGTTNYKRTANVGITWNAGALTLTKSRISGFFGIYGYAGVYKAINSVDSSTDTITTDSISFCCHQRVMVFSTGTLPAPLTTEPTFYWPLPQTSTTMKLSLTEGGAPIDLTSNGTGTLTFIVPEAINTGAVWSNLGGPITIDDCYLSANYNPLFLGAGENGSANQATISSGATETGATLSNVTNLQIGDYIALETHTPSWAPSIDLYGTVGTVASTDKLTRTAHGLLNGDNVYFCPTIVADVCVSANGLDPQPTRYYVINTTTDDFQVSLTRGGSAVNIAADGNVQLTAGGHKWINAIITGISGNDITYNTFVRYEGFNTPDKISPYDYSPSHALPMSGGLAKWRGFQVHDFTFTHNTVDLDPTSAQYVYDRTGSHPKAIAEIKCMDGGIFEGNTFEGWPSSIAITLANQNGTSPWVQTRNIMVRSNFFKSFSVVGFAQLLSGTLAPNGENLTFENNLAIGVATSTGGNGGHNGPGWFIAGAGGGKGNPLILKHNTIINEEDIDGGYAITVAGIPQPLEGVGGNIWKDNIFFWNRNGVQGVMATQFPNLSEDQNIIVDNPTWTVGSDGITTGGSPKFPNSLYAASKSSVGFVNITTCLAGTINSCGLDAGSIGHLTSTDGKDIGVDITALNNALAGGSGEPTIRRCNWHANPRCNL